MALTRITKGVIKPNENYDTHNINSTGIVTAIGLDVNGNGDISGNLNVGGVLTYEDVTSIDSVGIITARDGIDCNGDIDVDGHTNLDNVSVAGVSTYTGLVDINGGATVNGGLTSTLLTINGGSNPATINHTGGNALTLARSSKEISFNANYGASNTYANMSVTSGMDLRFTVGGRDGITIDGSNGYMGIDTDAPTAPLHIASNSAALKITRGGKDFLFNANYGASNTYMLAQLTSGMDLRFNLGGGDRIVFKSAGHIEPVTDSQINLGADAKRFANVYADTLYGNGDFVDLDVDGHTNLDNVSIAGISTFSGIVDAVNTPASIRVAQDIQHKGDADTKITFPAADTISFETGGSERLSIRSDGNIDINGTPPWTVTGGNYRNLSISGSNGSSSGFLWLGNGAATNNADFDLGRINFMNGGTIVARVVGSTDTSANDDGRLTLITKKTGETEAERLRIASDGIITQSATHPQIILKDPSNRQVSLRSPSSSNLAALGTDTNHSLIFYTNGYSNERLRIKSGGTIAIPGQGSSNANPRLLIEDGHGGDNDFSISQYEDANGTYTLIGQNVQLDGNGNENILDSNHKTASIYLDARNNGAILFNTGGTNTHTEKLRITSGGKVGINEASNINGRLHVQHDALGEMILYATRYNDQTNDKPILAVTEANMSGMTGGSGLVIGNHNRDIHIGPVFGSSAQVVTGSTSGLRIAHNGLMGLGVNPTSHNNTTAFQIYDDYNSQGYPRIRLTNQSSGTASSDGYEIVLNGSDLDAVHRLRENADIYFMTNNIERLRITSDGKVGIGEDNPPSRFFVKDTYIFSCAGGNATTGMQIGAYDSGNNSYDPLTLRASNIRFYISGNERLHINSSGFVKNSFSSNNSTVAEGIFINNMNNGTGNNASLIFSNDSGERKKASISHIDTGSYGAGDLVFALDGADSGELHLTNDEKLRIRSDGHVVPGADATQDFGTSSKRWRNVYTTDLQLSNVGGGGNEVDGTEGNWTLQEGESDIYMINRKTGKKYKMMLQEVS